MNRGTKMLVAAIALVSVAAVSQALEVQYVDSGPQLALRTYHLWEPMGATYNAGIYNILVRDTPTSPERAVDAFCIDLKQATSTNWEVYEDTLLAFGPAPHGGGFSFPMGMDRSVAVMELWGRNYDTIGSSDTIAAAMQVAMWEIIFDDDALISDMTGQFFIAPGEVATLAQAMVDEIDGTGAANFGLRALISDDYQCFVYDDSAGMAVIPEPVTLLTALIGLCSLGSYVRKRVA